jgi:hypothetical protein
MMKTLLVALFALGSFSSFANNGSIVCDQYRLFGGMKRIEINHISGVNWELTALKEESCGRGSGCSRLAIEFKKTVSLMESPAVRDVIVSIPHLSSGDNVTIDISNKKCKVKIQSENYRFSGELLD